jgi:hypothetical protein
VTAKLYLPGFTAFENRRLNSQGGGVATFVSQNIAFVIDQTPKEMQDI